MKQLSDVAKATLQQFNAAFEKIDNRNKQIERLQAVVADTNEQARKNKEARLNIKELKEQNAKDVEFVKQAIDFYEDITGEAVGIGGLFNQDEGLQND